MNFSFLSLDRKYYFLSTSLFFKLLINLFVVFYIAKTVSVDDFGSFSLAFIIFSLSTLFLDFGFNLKGLVLTSKSELEVKQELSSMIGAKIVFVLGAIIFLSIYLVLNNYNTKTNEVIIILGVASIPNSFGNFFLNNFKIINRYDKEAVGYAIQGIILVLLLGFNELYGLNDITYYAFIFLIAKSAYMLFATVVFKKGFSISMTFNTREVIKSIRTSTPYGIHLILSASIIYIDTLILSFLSSLENVGLYQAGMRMIMASMLIAVIISDAFIPEISKQTHNNSLVTKKLSELFEFVLLFAALTTITLFFYQKTIIQLLFSDDYLVLTESIYLILTIIFLRYLGIVPGIVLTSYGKQFIRARAVVVSIIVSIMLNFLLIPIVGIKGAFLASLVAHVILNIIYLYFGLNTVLFVRWPTSFKTIIVLLMIVLLQVYVFLDTIYFLILTIIINGLLIVLYYGKFKNTKA